MISYSQNKEDIIIAGYYQNRTGTLLDLGANDGITLSNSRRFLMEGWTGVLVEPSKAAHERLKYNCSGLQVTLLDVAVGDKCTDIEFMESGVHFKDGTDVALVSTISEPDYNKWKDTTQWNRYTVKEVDVPTLFKLAGTDKFDFVSIDIEGMDILVLEQMDLTSMGTTCVCVEHNGKEIEKYINHCSLHGLKELHRNHENIIFVK